MRLRKRARWTLVSLFAIGAAAFFFARHDDAEQMRVLKEWTGISRFPINESLVEVTSEGDRVTRTFVAEFEAPPETITQWIRETPALQGAKQTTNADGSTRYLLRAAGGAQFAEVIVSYDRRHVRIRAYWS